MLKLGYKCLRLRVRLALFPLPVSYNVVPVQIPICSQTSWHPTAMSKHLYSNFHGCDCVKDKVAIVKAKRGHSFPLSSLLFMHCSLHLEFFKSKRNISNQKSYEEVCEETLDSLAERFEDLLAEKLTDSQADVTLNSGVLTVHLGDNKGTYVINQQSPNKQIWLSSPFSGPKRYDFINGRWIYHRDGTSLHDLLSREISDVIGTEVDFCVCLYGK